MIKKDLAINGGQPTITMAAPTWPVANEAIRECIRLAMDDGTWGSYDSHWTRDLVTALEGKFACAEILLCSSGTIGVELALRGAEVKPDDEVIMAGYDFPGNFRAVESVGAFPVLIDVVENGWVIDAEQISAAISPTTKAIIVSHLHGQIADMPMVRQVIESHNQRSENQITIIEDACQTPGGKLNAKPLGSFGDVGVISFGGSKLLSAGRGGAVISNSPDILQRTRIYNSRGNEAFPLSQLQAAVLGPQLQQLDVLNARRSGNADRLIAATADVETLVGLKQIVEAGEDSTTAFYKLPWLLKDRTTGWSRSEFIAAVQAEGAPIDVGFRGFLRRSPRRCRRIGNLVNSQIAAQQTLLLHHPILLESDETIDLIATAIRRVATA